VAFYQGVDNKNPTFDFVVKKDPRLQKDGAEISRRRLSGFSSGKRPRSNMSIIYGNDYACLRGKEIGPYTEKS